MDGSLKSQSLKVVSLDEVTTSRWVGWVQQCVSSWSWPEKAQLHNSYWKYTIRTEINPSVFVPVSEWTSSDVSTSYRFAALSQDAVTTCLPPTNQSAAITTPWWLFNVAVATRTVGTSEGPSPSTSPSSRSDESWSSSHGACKYREWRRWSNLIVQYVYDIFKHTCSWRL